MRDCVIGVYSQNMTNEQYLDGGNTSGAVVRIGDTVRKPWSKSTPSVMSIVEALRARGIDAPAPLGRDEYGRQIQEFVPGTLAIDHRPLPASVLVEVGRLVRAIHDASQSFVPDPQAVWKLRFRLPAMTLSVTMIWLPGISSWVIDWSSSTGIRPLPVPGYGILLTPRRRSHCQTCACHLLRQPSVSLPLLMGTGPQCL